MEDPILEMIEARLAKLLKVRAVLREAATLLESLEQPTAVAPNGALAKKAGPRPGLVRSAETIERMRQGQLKRYAALRQAAAQ